MIISVQLRLVLAIRAYDALAITFATLTPEHQGRIAALLARVHVI